MKHFPKTEDVTKEYHFLQLKFFHLKTASEEKFNINNEKEILEELHENGNPKKKKNR